MSTPYLAPPTHPTQAQPQAAHGPDATADFYSALQDPARWIIKQGVPIFKAHERIDPATGKTIKVDLHKLHRIATNMQRLERQHGVPVRLTLGHTEPGKPETHQPPVAGYYRNPRVQPFGPNGEPAVVVDEWLDPQYGPLRKNYPYRSSEYYDDTEQITGVALLTRDPYLDLGVVAYSRHPVPYRYVVADVPFGDPFVFPQQQPTYGTPPVPLTGFVPQQAPPPAYYAQVPQQPPQPVPQQVSQPAFYGVGQAPQPAQAQTPQDQQFYPQAQAPTPYAGQWPGPPHRRHNIGHQHPSGGAIYSNYDHMSPGGGIPLGGRMPPGRPPMGRPGMGRPGMGRPGMGRPGMGRPPMGPPGMGAPAPFSRARRYATDPEDLGEGMEDDLGGGPPDAGGGPMQELYTCLSEALGVLSSMMEGGGGGMPTGGGLESGSPPQSPFPGQLSRSRGGRGQGGGKGDYRRTQYYSRQPAGQQPRQQFGATPPSQPPTPQGQPPMRTITGQPVGYQLRLDQLQYQNNELSRAVQVLLYERDQADTDACVAQIQNLAAQGFQVGEYEVSELKKKPTREERAAYLQHIVTKYQKVPTDYPPPLMGDPTPVFEEGGDRPLSQQEMDEALRMAAGQPNPNAFTQAINYIKAQRNGAARGPVVGGFPPAQQPQQQPQQMPAWMSESPYEPSANGTGAY